MYRLSQRVRQNSINLLRMGLSEATIRSKYLVSGEAGFGGSKARELSWDHINALQRKNVALPPDTNYTEREGLFRFDMIFKCWF